MPFINIFDTGGINQSLPHTKINRNECTQLDNFMPSYTATNASELISFMQKRPAEANFLNTVSGKSGLGLYQFKSYDGQTLYTLGAWTDGALYLSDGSTWATTLASGLSTAHRLEFQHAYRKETKDTVCIITNAYDAMMKWNVSDSTVGYLYNKGGEGSSLITGILTFTNSSDQVTGSGTNFDPELQAGDYIRVGDYELYTDWVLIQRFPPLYAPVTAQRDAVWYRIKSVESDTALTLESVHTGETIVGGSGTSQRKAQPLTGTLTFTKGSAAVTGAGTNFDPEVIVGQHIRKNATGRWYEVKTVTDATNIVLRTTFKENTGAGIVSGSQKSLPMNIYGYVKLFEAKGISKMIYAYDVTGSDYGLWRHSVPGDPEDVPTLNKDVIPGAITGVFQVGNYLGFFTGTNYYMYKYVAASDDFVRIGAGNKGCSSSTTIQEIPGGVIFLSTTGLYKISIQEGLEFKGEKVKLELYSATDYDLPIRPGAFSTTTKVKTPNSAIDRDNQFYFLTYPKGTTYNQYMLVLDYKNNKFYRWTSINAASIIHQRRDGASSRLMYLPSDDTGQAKILANQYFAPVGEFDPMTRASGVIKFGYWSLPRSDGALTNMKIQSLAFKILQNDLFNGTIALNFKTDWDLGGGTTITPTAWTNTTDYKVKHIVYPVNQTCHHIQFTLTDSMTAGGYAIVGISIKYEDGSEETYGKHTV